MSSVAVPPTIPGSLNVDTMEVNKVLKIVDQVVGDALSNLNSWKGAVKAATTANITLSGTQTIDGVALAVDDKVLVKDQATGSENGLYIVQTEAWYRSDDMATGSSAAGAAVFVTEGTSQADQIFVCTDDEGAAVVGTDALTFVSLTATISAAGADTNVQFNSAGNLAGDAGFTYDGAGAVASTVSMTSALLSDGAGGSMAAGTVTGTTLTDGTLSSTAGTVTGGVSITSATVSDGSGSTMNGGVVTSVTLTDGTMTCTAGILAATNLTATGILTSNGQTDLATAGTVGFFGTTAAAQHSTTGDVTGFVAGAGTSANDDSVYAGAAGATAYTVGDVVTALKAYGLLAP